MIVCKLATSGCNCGVRTVVNAQRLFHMSAITLTAFK